MSVVPSQKRYRDFKSPVESKDSAESLAILSGIGPKFGFDYVPVTTIVGDTVNITIRSIENSSPGLSPGIKNRYLVDKLQNILYPRGGVITPDGILTLVTEDLNMSFNKLGASVFMEGELAYVEAVIVANHSYIEEEGLLNSTSFELIVNTDEVSIYEVTKPAWGINSWLSHPSLSVLDKKTEIVVGLLKVYINNSNTTCILPYDYQWPNPINLSQNTWEAFTTNYINFKNGTNDSLTDVNEQIGSLSTALSQQATEIGTNTENINGTILSIRGYKKTCQVLNNGVMFSSSGQWDMVVGEEQFVYSLVGPGRSGHITGRMAIKRATNPLNEAPITLTFPLSTVLDTTKIFTDLYGKNSDNIEDNNVVTLKTSMGANAIYNYGSVVAVSRLNKNLVVPGQLFINSSNPSNLTISMLLAEFDVTDIVDIYFNGKFHF